MDPQLKKESEKLIASWMRHDQFMLRDYLVSDVEDPRINVQSIFTRHFLIESVFGRKFPELMKRELEFAAVMNWLLRLKKENKTTEDFASILYSLQRNADEADGIKIPGYISRAFTTTPADMQGGEISHYLKEALKNFNDALNTFQGIWNKILANESPKKISVLEPACGSANDFRFLESYGLARFLDYHGFDLCEKNIANASAMFPLVDFKTGNAFAIDAADKSYDYTIIHDLFEHFSIEGMEAAVAEICRVTREGICAGFFSMYEGDDHIIREVDDYHWNTLSLEKTAKLFTQKGFTIQVIHVGTFLKWKLNCESTHNPNAYTLMLRK